MTVQTSYNAVHFTKKNCGKRLLWLSLIPVLLAISFFGLHVYVYGLGGTLSPAKLVDIATCGNGDYRLLEYKYDNSDGYFELVDRNGKIFGKSAFSEGTDLGGIRWAKDCHSVNVGTDKDRIDLKILN